MFPDETLEEGDIGIVGIKGGGKTHAAKTLIERAVRAGRRSIVLDPTSAWRGMQTASNGVEAGLPMLIFGGTNANIPITFQMGEAVADFLHETRISAVIDLRHLIGVRFEFFAYEFLMRLYELQLESCDPLWLVIDEADRFAPQTPRTTEQKLLLGITDDIASRSRISGIRLITCVTRLAKINKNIISMARALVALRMPGTHDREATSRWMDGIAGSGRQIKGTLATLQRGEAWVATPDRSKPFRMTFPALSTMDTSATPAPRATSPFTPEQLAQLVLRFEELAARQSAISARGGPDVAAAAVKRLRAALDLSREEFASIVEMTPSNFARLENNEVSPTVRLLHRIGELAGAELRIDYRMGRREETGTVVPFVRALDAEGDPKKS